MRFSLYPLMLLPNDPYFHYIFSPLKDNEKPACVFLSDLQAITPHPRRSYYLSNMLAFEVAMSHIIDEVDTILPKPSVPSVSGPSLQC